jgi:YVTN family beta-propeller protein
LDKFTVTVADGYGGTKVLTVSAVIAPADSAPVATVSIDPANSATGVVTGVVKATDPDGDPVTYVAGTTTTPGGTVTITATGQFTYTPTTIARQDAAKANTVIATISGFSYPTNVVFSPDGKLAYVSIFPTPVYPTGAISVVDVATNKIVDTMSGFSSPALVGDALAISPDGTRLYAAHRNGSVITVIDTATKTVTAVITGSGPGAGGALAVSPDGSRLYALGNQKVSVINTATNAVITTMKIAGSGAIALSPDGNHLYVAIGMVNYTGPGTVSVFNTNTFASEAEIAAPAGSFDVDVSPDGTHTYVTGYYGVTIIDNSSKQDWK